MQINAIFRLIKAIIAIFRIKQLLLGRGQSGIGAGVGVDIFKPESELESLEIRRLRSPVESHHSRKPLDQS